MKLPRRIRVGRRKYVVEKQVFKPSWLRGVWNLEGRRIVIQRGYSKRQQAETFWHEITHAILHDMKHPLYKNEKFVEAFSKRLNNTIHSAEFDDKFDVEKWKRENL